MPRWPNRQKDGAKTAPNAVTTEKADAKDFQNPPPHIEVKKAKVESIKAYTGKDDLPKYEVIGKVKSERGVAIRVKYGEPRYICHRAERGVVKVMAYYKSPRGVIRKIVASLKLTSKSPAKREADKALLAKLKAAKIPGAF